MVNDSWNYIKQGLAANAPRIKNEFLNLLGATDDQLTTLETAVNNSGLPT